MRWFVIFLLLANIALYFWVQRESRPADEPASLAAPDVGHLRLLRDELETGVSPATGASPVNGATDSEGGPAAVEMPVSAVSESATDTAASVPMVTGVDPAQPPATILPGGEPVGEKEVDAQADEFVPPADPEPQLPQDPIEVQWVESAPDAGAVAEETGPRDSETEARAVAMTSPPQQQAEPATADAAEAAERAEVARDDFVNPSPMVCRKLGPLDDEQARDLVANLGEGARLLDDVSETYRQADGYYVMIPPLPGRAEGRAMLQRLNEAGITDTWLFRSGENENAISLGLFSRRSSAERHAATISGKGFATEVRERKREFSGRFLVIGSSVAGSMDAGNALPDGVGTVSVACPRP